MCHKWNLKRVRYDSNKSTNEVTDKIFSKVTNNNSFCYSYNIVYTRNSIEYSYKNTFSLFNIFHILQLLLLLCSLLKCAKWTLNEWGKALKRIIIVAQSKLNMDFRTFFCFQFKTEFTVFCSCFFKFFRICEWICFFFFILNTNTWIRHKWRDWKRRKNKKLIEIQFRIPKQQSFNRRQQNHIQMCSSPLFVLIEHMVF